MDPFAKFKITSRRKKRIFIAVFAFLLVTCISFYLLSVNMRPALAALAESRVKAAAAQAMNNAVIEAMNRDESHTELINVKETGERVYMIQADSRGMNLFAAQCANMALSQIIRIGEQGVSIPLGTISGVSIFAGKGPVVYAYFTPEGSVQSEFRSEFVSAGINQTLYRVKLKLTASISLVIPGVSETVSVETEAAIAESVIVGEVPEVYTDVANQDDMLNLIPTELP